MTRNRFCAFMFISLVLSIAIAFAEQIDVQVLDAKNEIDAGSNAEFTLKITNNGLERDVFSIQPDEFNVYPFSDFAARIEARPYQVKLEAEESALVTIIIETLDTTTPNKFYESKIVVSSIIHPQAKTALTVKTFVASAKNIVEIIPSLPQQLTPGVEIKVPLKLKNRSRLTMEKLQVVAATDIPKIAEPLTLVLKPQEEIQQEMIFFIDPATAPGKRKITIAAYDKDQLRGSFAAEVMILPKERVEEDRDVKRGFLSSATTITRENKGNAPSDQKIEANYNLFQRVFSSMDPKPAAKGGRVIWEFTLQPGEKKTIMIESNYQPLLYGIMIIVIFTVIVLFSIERSVVVKKRMFRGKEPVEGVKEYKIFLHVRNGKRYTLQDVKVMDLVPNAVHLTSDFGSLRPDRVQHGERATRLLWTMTKLEPREERVFSYKVQKKEAIVGEVVLPVAIIQYVDDKDKFAQVKSMRVVLE